MAGRLAEWLVRKLGLIAVLEMAADRAYFGQLANERARLTGAENSLRLIEKRLAMIENLKLADGEVGELAARRQKAEDDANGDRLDASAAKLRGMTLEDYRADRDLRKADKVAKQMMERP